MLTLNNLQVQKGAKTKKRILGRGNASGRGNYSGRGMKGQKSRSGVSGLKRLGMKKMIAQLPKHRGFNRVNPAISIVNLSDLEKNFKVGEEVNVKSLFKLEIIDNARDSVKVLGNGKLEKKLIVRAHYFSKSAKDAIIKAGGKVIETPKKRRVVIKNKKRLNKENSIKA